MGEGAVLEMDGTDVKALAGVDALPQPISQGVLAELCHRSICGHL